MAVVLLAFFAAVTFGLPLLLVDSSFFTTGADLLSVLGRYVAFVAFLVLTWQYVWTAKLKFLERLISYDRRVAIHRTLGFLGILFLSLHPIFVLGAYAAWEVPLTLSPVILLGFIAFLILLMIAGSTFLGRIWGVRYESWKRLHWFNFVVLTIAFVHSLLIGSDLYAWRRVFWIALWGIHLLVLMAKFWHKIRVWAPTYKVLDVKRLSSSVIGLKLERPAWRYFPGQFVFLTARFGKHWESWHPFSLTSSIAEKNLSVAIKGVGDFSTQAPKIQAGDRIKVDGPYGGFSAQLFPDTRYVLVAGGVGITPVHGILKSLYIRQDPPEVRLIYCVHHEADILFRQDLESWFDERAQWQLTYIVSSQPDWPGEKGRLTPERIVPLCEDDLSGTFFLCGPLAMVRSLRRYLIGRGVPRRRIRSEQFVFLP